ncbi:MAG: Gfo/Idh/MocA family oxidoreductase, partial [Deltaproteobacteria bacterium]|nr:Gfo/Idh/MocA family oxidoreductase [Deltaproteobacteria bacterium]
QLMQQKVIGDIRIVRMVLGHGARPGYDKEWRTDPEKGGGGALLDPGVHCLDLMRWFCGEPHRASFYPLNAFWPIRHEDNALALFQFDNNVTAFIQSSITEWRNKFRLEIIGTDGYINVEGRGGSYGPQRIAYAQKWWWLKSPPAEEIVETYPDGDESFYEETKEFIAAIREERQPIGNGKDGLRAAEIIDQLYEAKNRYDIPLS